MIILNEKYFLIFLSLKVFVFLWGTLGEQSATDRSNRQMLIFVRISMWLLFILQNAGNTWPGTQQVLVGSWQQIPGLPAQRAVQQPLLTDTLASQALQDSWRQTLVLDNLEQSSLASLVRNHNLVISLSIPRLIIKYDLTVSHTFSLS